MSKRKKKKIAQPWSPPGTISADPNAPRPEIDLMAFSAGELVERKLDELSWVEQHKEKYPVIWLNVDGLGDAHVVAEIGRIYNLHRLALEDVVNVHQRAKVDLYDGYFFVVLRMLHQIEGRIETEQISLFFGPHFVITFQEGIPGDCLEPVRERIRKETARIRGGQSDFLAYHLIDAVIDSYFPVLEKLGEQLEDLENEVLLHPTRAVVRRIHDIKRDLLIVRRAVWPLREAINPLFREDVALVSPETRVFLRDCYDHCVQVIDLVESYRELGSSLMDVYLSSISNRMNEVMKVLTIITTIFVPLTFVAGIYGMNFNTEKSPWNMPELNWYYGYPLCLLSMVVIALLELGFFWRLGWIFQPPEIDLPPSSNRELIDQATPHHQ